jgi:hypothetical protein
VRSVTGAGDRAELLARVKCVSAGACSELGGGELRMSFPIGGDCKDSFRCAEGCK